MTENEQVVRTLLSSAKDAAISGKSDDAMRFSQAAVNAANAIICLTNNKKLELEVKGLRP